MRIWVALAAAGSIAEIRAIRRGHGTLTETTRLLFRTDTPLGVATWTVAWMCGTGWVYRHILEG